MLLLFDVHATALTYRLTDTLWSKFAVAACQLAIYVRRLHNHPRKHTRTDVSATSISAITTFERASSP